MGLSKNEANIFAQNGALTQFITVMKVGVLAQINWQQFLKKDNSMKIGNKIKLRNGNAGTIVYESPFGKLLIVEHNCDELPPSHWHNADGTFYADCTSDLDVVQE